jgi:cytochrome P450
VQNHFRTFASFFLFFLALTQSAFATPPCEISFDRLPGARGLELIRLIPRLRENYADVYIDMMKKHGNFTYVGLTLNALMVYDADAARYVLRENAENYHKSQAYDPLRTILGNGLVTSEDQLWKTQRRLMSPEFRPSSIERFEGPIVKRALELGEEWKKAAEAQTPRNVLEDTMSTALRIVGDTLLGSDLTSEISEISDPIYILLKYAIDRQMSLLNVPEYEIFPSVRKAKQAQRTLDQAVKRIIAQRRANPGNGEDLLGRLLSIRDPETGRGIDDQQLLDEVKTMIGAGHETVSLSMAWTWYLLSLHPEIEAKLNHELQEVLGGRPPTLQDLPRLRYTEQVIKESMRLYPPVPAVSRNNLKEDKLGHVVIPPKTHVEIAIYAIHRNPQYWENPEAFDPDRFSPEREPDPRSCIYLPFSTGPRVCIGEHMAMMEAKLVLATLAQKFRLELIDPTSVRAEAVNTLRPRNGLWMRILRKDSSAARP